MQTADFPDVPQSYCNWSKRGCCRNGIFPFLYGLSADQNTNPKEYAFNLFEAFRSRLQRCLWSTICTGRKWSRILGLQQNLTSITFLLLDLFAGTMSKNPVHSCSLTELDLLNWVATVKTKRLVNSRLQHRQIRSISRHSVWWFKTKGEQRCRRPVWP